MTEVRLIATDLDGTIVGGMTDIHLYRDFGEKLIEYRKKYNTVWSVCTGRGLRATLECLYPMDVIGIKPDFIIVRHAYIFEDLRFGYLPHVIWNLRIRHVQNVNRNKMRLTIEFLADMMTGLSFGVAVMHRSDDRMKIRFDSEQSAMTAEKMLVDKTRQFMHIRVYRLGREIDMFQLPFTKGLAVTELVRHLGLNSGEVLAVGDGLNDISMLEENVAAFVGCPGNAVPEVQEVVHKRGGHISRTPSLAGVLNVMDAHLSGNVDSSLPPGWQPPPIKFNKLRNRRSNFSNEGDGISGFVLFAITISTVLIVVAWFNIIPFSSLILKPFYLVIKMIEKIVSLFT